MENNPDSLARNQVATLIVNYPEAEINRLHRYHARALKDPDNRAISSQSTQSTLYSQNFMIKLFCKIFENHRRAEKRICRVEAARGDDEVGVGGKRDG